MLPLTLAAHVAFASPVVVQGYKVRMQGPSFDYDAPGPDLYAVPPGDQQVWLDTYMLTSNPYFFIDIPAGNHTVSVSIPNGWSVQGSTLCISGQSCPLASIVGGASRAITADPSTTYDLWWYFTPPPGVVQGTTRDQNGNLLAQPQTIIAGKSFYSQNPYSATMPEGTYSVVAAVPLGYAAYYSVCNNCTSHPNTSYVPGYIARMNITANQYTDIDWEYYPVANRSTRI